MENNYDLIIKDDKRITYLLREDNTLKGVSYYNDEILKVESNYVNSIFSKIRFNNNCKYIKEENGNKIYYDEENGLYHFIVDNKENIDLFIKVNCFNVCYCNNKYNYGYRLKEQKFETLGIKIKNGILEISETFLVLLLGFSIGTSIVMHAWGIDNKEYLLDTPKRIEFITENKNNTNAEQIISMIEKSTDLTSEEKSILINNDLINDIIPYYMDNYMQTHIWERLYKLKTVSFDSPIIYKNNNGNDVNIIGYYSFLAPNQLHILNGSDNSTMTHEFIHLLQRSFGSKYIIESSCELINYEYYKDEELSYSECIVNLKKLMDIVGPKVVWEYNFSCNDRLFEIIKENLSNYDYAILYAILNSDPLHLSDLDHAKVSNILDILAKNYLDESSYKLYVDKYENGCININNEEESEKYYFNTNKMDDKELYIYVEQGDVKYLVLQKIIKDENGNIVYDEENNPTYKLITIQEDEIDYKKLVDEGEVKVLYSFTEKGEKRSIIDIDSYKNNENNIKMNSDENSIIL